MSGYPERRLSLATASALALAVFSLAFHVPAGATNWSWTNAAGGASTTATNWWNGFGQGVPTAGDHAIFGPAGGYQVTWNSPADTVQDVECNSGRPRFAISGRLGIGGDLYAKSESLTVSGGTLRATQWYLGWGANNSFLGTNAATLHATDSTVACFFAFGGKSLVKFTGGTRFRSNGWLEMGVNAADVCTTTVIGLGGPLARYSGLQLLSALGGGLRGSIVVGKQGAGVLNLSNGGFATLAGDLYIAKNPSANGTVHVYNTAMTPFLPSLNVTGQTILGADDPLNPGQGYGNLTIEKGSATLVGKTTVKHGTITVRNGASLTAGDLYLTPSPSNPTGAYLSVRGSGTVANISKTLQIGAGYANGCLCNVAEVESGAVLNHTGSLIYGDKDSELLVFYNSTLNSTGELHLRGELGLQGTVHALLVSMDHLAGDWSTIDVYTTSTINARVRFPSGSYLWFNHVPGSKLTLGDSTAADGFVSDGYLVMASDTMVILDKDGADLGGLLDLGNGTLILPRGARVPPGARLFGGGKIVGNVVNHGELHLYTATLDIQGRFVHDHALALGDGTLHILPGASLMARGALTQTLALDGELDLGGWPSRLELGAFAAGPASTTHMIIGPRAGGLWDTLVVTGNASLSGHLALRTGPESLPLVGDTLTILTAGSITGTFAFVTLNGVLGAGQVSVIYGPTSVRIALIGPIAGSPGATSTAGSLKLAASGTWSRPAFSLQLPDASRVRLVVYDISGRQRAAFDPGMLPPGSHQFPLPAAELPSGVFLARCTVSDGSGKHVLTARALKVH